MRGEVLDELKCRADQGTAPEGMLILLICPPFRMDGSNFHLHNEVDRLSSQQQVICRPPYYLLGFVLSLTFARRSMLARAGSSP